MTLRKDVKEVRFSEKIVSLFYLLPFSFLYGLNVLANLFLIRIIYYHKLSLVACSFY